MLNPLSGKGIILVQLLYYKATTLFVLLGLLVPEISSQKPKTPEEEVAFLKVRLALMKDRYRLLCNQYSSLADNCSAPAKDCKECPEGWLQVEDQCFHLNTDKQDFSTSAEKCKDIGAHLAILTTRKQHEAVEKEGRRIAGTYIHYWIGLSDIETEGDWRWVDNSTLTTAFWDPYRREPDNNQAQGPEGEDCAVVDSYTQKWYDVPCEFTYPRICQKAANPLL
uniref:C-type lectin domain family 17, member A-like n=1 Tax=Cyprinodon variegatus TaxID=28743 RepID=A0A3Q2EJN7_CYPVA